MSHSKKPPYTLLSSPAQGQIQHHPQQQPQHHPRGFTKQLHHPQVFYTSTSSVSGATTRRVYVLKMLAAISLGAATLLMTAMVLLHLDIQSSWSTLEDSPSSAALPQTQDSPAASPPPHIIIILADDYGWNDVGYHGSPIKTPALDRLASEGVKLENYYVQQVCTPSRSQLLTGRYQIRTGLQHKVIFPPVPNGLPLRETTLPQVLRNAGYATHHIGKWHLGFFMEEYMPHNRGFDTVFGFLQGDEDYFNHTRCYRGAGCGLDLRHNMDVVYNKTGLYSAHMFADEAIRLIQENNNQQPMFLYLAMQSCHVPLQAPEEYIKPYEHIHDEKRRIFSGMVAAMDEAIGNVTDALKRSSMYDNSVVIFSTDNGGHSHEGGNNWPLRGMKTTLWEGGIRGVGFVHSPLLKNNGVMNHELMHVSDWFPTVVRLAGVDPHTLGLQLDGQDVWDTISTGVPGPKSELLYNIDPLERDNTLPRHQHAFDTRVQAGIRVGHWKLLTGNPGDHGRYAPPTMPYDGSLAETLNFNQSVYLFNITDDPLEKTDLSHDRPDVVKFLLDRLWYYNATAVPCEYPPDDPRANPKYRGGVWGPWM